MEINPAATRGFAIGVACPVVDLLVQIGVESTVQEEPVDVATFCGELEELPLQARGVNYLHGNHLKNSKSEFTDVELVAAAQDLKEQNGPTLKKS